MRPPCASEGSRSEREGAPHDAKKVFTTWFTTVHRAFVSGCEGAIDCAERVVCPVYVAPRVVGRYVLSAPEGCPHGTHTSGTAYTRGTYSRVHTQTPTHKHKHTVHVIPHRRKSHHRTSTCPTAGGRSPPSRSTRSCRIARVDAPPPRPPPVRLELARRSCASASQPLATSAHPRVAAVELSLGHWTRCRLHHTAVRACAAGRYVATA